MFYEHCYFLVAMPIALTHILIHADEIVLLADYNYLKA